jgi:two-component system, cell cycle sensor histidine kinase and response regulator CckA
VPEGATGLFHANPLPMWLVDLQSHRLLDVNQAAVTEYGYSREEFLRMSVDDLGPGEGARFDTLVGNADPAMRRSALGRHTTRHGRTLTVEIRAHEIEWDGRLVGLLATRDITEQQRARDEASRLADAVDAADLAIITTTVGGEITSWNRAAHRLFGYPANEVLGQPLGRIAGEQEERRFHRLLRVAAGGGRVSNVEMQARAKDGRTIAIRLSVSPLRAHAGHVAGLSAVAQDITVRRSLEDQLRQAQKMEAIGRLAGGIAHDFNNLLTAIGGYAELVRDSLDPGDERREDADEVVRATRRAAELTGQLLAFSRRQVLAPTVVSVNEVVVAMQPILERLIGSEVNLVVGLAPDAGHVRVDRSQLEQVILNLAINGRDAMPSGGNLLIETASLELDEPYATTHAEVEPGRYALLAVSDQGPGLSPEAQARLFEPFFTTKPAGKGTGLGLATVYGIVRQSGGHVFPYSQSGMGTTFRVYLPQVAPGGRETPAPEERRPAVLTGPRTVLVVDDERSIRELMRSVLVTHGYRVLVAASGTDALAAATEAGVIDLVVTDVAMPGLSGPRLVEQLREGRADLPVIYVSGYPEDHLPAGLGAGARFLPKPFSPADLVRWVEDVLAERDRPVDRHSPGG